MFFLKIRGREHWINKESTFSYDEIVEANTEKVNIRIFYHRLKAIFFISKHEDFVSFLEELKKDHLITLVYNLKDIPVEIIEPPILYSNFNLFPDQLEIHIKARLLPIKCVYAI